MTGRSATAGVAGGAGWGSSAGHSTTSGAGGTEPRDECGRIVLSCRRQPSMTTLASWSVEKISPFRDDGLRFSPSLDRAGHNVMEAHGSMALCSGAEVRDNSTSWPRSRPTGQKEFVRITRSNQVAIPPAVVLLAARAARQAEHGKS